MTNVYLCNSNILDLGVKYICYFSRDIATGTVIFFFFTKYAFPHERNFQLLPSANKATIKMSIKKLFFSFLRHKNIENKEKGKEKKWEKKNLSEIADDKEKHENHTEAKGSRNNNNKNRRSGKKNSSMNLSKRSNLFFFFSFFVTHSKL